MKKCVFVFTSLLSVFGMTLAQAELVISEPTIRILPPGTPNTAVYFSVENSGEKDVSLVDVRTTIADKAELHNHVQDGDVMKMEKQQAVVVAAGEKVTFQPGGLHIMVFGIKQPLEMGEQVEVVLITEDHKQVAFSARAVMPGEHSHHHHH